jgi:hypothetical protein
LRQAALRRDEDFTTNTEIAGLVFSAISGYSAIKLFAEKG